MATPTIPIAARFWPRVEKGPGCWIWRGARRPNGYGQFWLNATNTSAHRVSWALHYGPVPDGLFVLHSCDNPPCVNPAHLFLGTAADNAHDRDAKGHGIYAPLRTHCIAGHDLSVTRTCNGCFICDRRRASDNQRRRLPIIRARRRLAREAKVA